MKAARRKVVELGAAIEALDATQQQLAAHRAPLAAFVGEGVGAASYGPILSAFDAQEKTLREQIESREAERAEQAKMASAFEEQLAARGAARATGGGAAADSAYDGTLEFPSALLLSQNWAPRHAAGMRRLKKVAALLVVRTTAVAAASATEGAAGAAAKIAVDSSAAAAEIEAASETVSCLLCTVTFYANHAHNLTRSP